MKKLHTYLFWAILGIGLGYVLFGGTKINVDVEAYELEINLLQQKIDSIQIQNTELKLEADSLEGKIGEYDIRINKLNSRIYVIKKETQQKLDNVDLFGDDELEKFFANRYRQHQDSIN